MRELLYGELKQLMREKNCIFLDTRSSSAFIGWKVDGSQRRGHIPGSTDFSAHWFQFLKEAKLSKNERMTREERLREQIQGKHLEDFEIFVLLGTEEKSTDLVRTYLEEHYSSKIVFFNINNWEEELVYYPNFYRLVPPEWVYELIKGEKPEFYNSPSYKIFECDWKGEGITFLSSHIPGAVHIDTNEFEKEPEWTYASEVALKAFLRNNGISEETALILYSNGDQAAEFKTALILQALGLKEIFILNGGYEAWRMKKYPVEQGSVEKPKSEKSFETHKVGESPLFVSISEVKEIFKAKGPEQIVDIRAWEEYSGKESGYDYITVKGRIPGAIYGGSWLQYKNIDDTMRNYEEIRTILEEHEIDENEKMAFFCGSAGWGAAMVVVYGQIAGSDKMAIFEGGWNEWVLDASNPIDADILE